MTCRPGSRKYSTWLQGLLAFGAAFSVVWYRAERSSSHHGSRVSNAVEAPRGAGPLHRVTASTPAPVLHREARDINAVRRSELADWGRFRYEHARLALSAEMAVRWAINTPVPLREVADACTDKEQEGSPAPQLSLSGEVIIQGRDVTIHGLGCDLEPDDRRDAAERFCDCLLAGLQQEYHARIPAEVPDGDLVAYDGILSLRLWRL